jgi:uncharacterized protein YkwD
MPKPLDERIQSAMGRGARAQTVAELVNEIGAALAEAQAEHNRLDALSTSIDASEAEADAAADGAVKAARRVTRLKAQREQVQARLDELMNSERRKRRLDEYAEIRARRDALAADVRKQWPELVGPLVALLNRIKASDAEIEVFQAQGLPVGCEWLASAEAIARDCPANFLHSGVSGMPRLTSAKLARLDSRSVEELAWPDNSAKIAARIAASEAAQKVVQRQDAERRAEAAKWQRFTIAPPPGATKPVPVECRAGRVGVRKFGEIEMTVEQAEAAQEMGCVVEKLRPGQTLGAIPSVANF